MLNRWVLSRDRKSATEGDKIVERWDHNICERDNDLSATDANDRYSFHLVDMLMTGAVHKISYHWVSK